MAGFVLELEHLSGKVLTRFYFGVTLGLIEFEVNKWLKAIAFTLGPR
jgi:hypothetical protein